jgi:hypothetical protein
MRGSMDNFMDRLEDRIIFLTTRINELEDRLNDLEKPRKRLKTTEIIHIEDIPDRMNFHEFRELVQRYGETHRIQMSRTNPRWAEFMYKNPRHSEALMADAEKLGMKIFYKCEEN